MRRSLWIKTIILITFSVSIARAAGDFGFGWVMPNEKAFESGFLSVYADASGKAERRLTWRAGVDFNYGMVPFDGANKDLTYSALIARPAIMWRPFASTQRPGGLQLGIGPSITNYRLRSETPGSGGGSSGMNITYRGSGGVSNLYAKLMNNVGYGSSYKPDQVITYSGTEVGMHAFIGYTYSILHVELLYEKGSSDLMQLGGLTFRFGFSF